MLYCLWATPPKFRAEVCSPKKIFDAIRLCSNTLAVMTERWEQTGILADVFELFTTEILTAEYDFSDGPSGAARGISAETVQAVRVRMERLKCLVLNKVVIRMIDEMLTQERPTGEVNVHHDQGGRIGSSSNGLEALGLCGTDNNAGAINQDHDLAEQYAPAQFFDWMGAAYTLSDIDPEQAIGVSDALRGFEML